MYQQFHDCNIGYSGVPHCSKLICSIAVSTFEELSVQYHNLGLRWSS